MKIKAGGDTFEIDEQILLEELKNILYDTGRLRMNSVNKAIAVQALQNSARRVKSNYAKKTIAELIVAVSTADDIQFIKEDTK